MAENLKTFAYQLSYLLTRISAADILDMLLVAAAFFVIFQVLRQTRALQVLRGAIIVAILGTLLLVLLPLRTFSLLLRGLLLAGAIALPFIFHDELRRLLSGLGRFGRRPQGLGPAVEQMKQTLVSAVTQLASRREGALIVLEGATPLSDIAATGIPVAAETVTAELLATIFHPRTPLHDGAVILRDGALVAAGCLLPVQAPEARFTHLGMRHRAALGLTSEIPDAMVIVVSEETGRISVAQGGHLHQGLSQAQLETRLDRFQGMVEQPTHVTWGQLAGTLKLWFSRDRIGATLQTGAIAVVLAFLAWISVTYQANPPQQVTIRNVPLVAPTPRQGLTIVGNVPTSVSVRAQTTADRLNELDAASIRASVSLSGLDAGVHRVPVEVTLADPRAQVISVTPADLDITLELITTRTLTPTVEALDPQSLPPGFALGEVQLSPSTVTVRGAQSLVGEVAEARVQLTLAGRRTDFQQTLAVQLLDAEGQPISGLAPDPEQVLATVPIQRTFATREVAVQANLARETVEAGYQIAEILISPSTVTLTGQQAVLNTVGDFVETAVITLTDATGLMVVDVPLLLPEGVEAIDAQGEPIASVTVRITIEPVTDYLVLTVQPLVINLAPNLSIQSLSPQEVNVLLSGPEPVIARVQQDPALVAVTLDLAGVGAGLQTVALTAEAPEGLTVQLFPPEFDVTLSQVQ
jgi:diadenylate cyclase